MLHFLELRGEREVERRQKLVEKRNPRRRGGTFISLGREKTKTGREDC